MIYVDSSALAKLILDEAETTALRAWMSEHDIESTVTNVIGVVELLRVAARVDAATVQRAQRLLEDVGQLALTTRAAQLAAALPPPQLRSLDALHVASASELAELTALVTYDRRMIDAARDSGLPVVSPGLAA